MSQAPFSPRGGRSGAATVTVATRWAACTAPTPPSSGVPTASSGTPTKRFLNGASWDGYGKPDTSNTGSCFSKSAGYNDNVSNCNKGHDGQPNQTNFGTAYYNYW